MRPLDPLPFDPPDIPLGTLHCAIAVLFAALCVVLHGLLEKEPNYLRRKGDAMPFKAQCTIHFSIPNIANTYIMPSMIPYDFPFGRRSSVH